MNRQINLKHFWSNLNQKVKKIKAKWLALFIILLGFYDIITSLMSIRFDGFFFTGPIAIFSGVSSFVTGFILTVIGYGLYKKYAIAWEIAIIFLIISLPLNFLGGNIPGIILSVLLIWLLLPKRKKFTEHTNISFDVKYLVALWVIFFVLLYGVLGSLFLGNQYEPDIKRPVQALYYTVITTTTVGYGDYTPQTDTAMLFTISLIIFGVGAFLSALTLIIQPLLNKRLEEFAVMVENKRKRFRRISS